MHDRYICSTSYELWIYIYIYVYIYIKWTVFVNVTTKSAQHAIPYVMVAAILTKWLPPWRKGRISCLWIKSVFDCLTIGIIHETMVVHLTWVWTFFNNYIYICIYIYIESRWFGVSTFRSVDVSACCRFGLSTFWSSTCRFFDLLSSYQFKDHLNTDRLAVHWWSMNRFNNVSSTN